jgi:hypothetical protein
MMDERSLPVKNKTAKHSMDALLKLPGISQAIEVVHNAVWERAVDQMIGDIAAGQLGTEVQNAMKESGDFGTVLDIDIVQDRQADLEDEYLELAALESGPKIAELWELSPAAGSLLASTIYWGFYRRPDDSPAPVSLVVKTRDRKEAASLRGLARGLQDDGVILATPGQMQKGHLYLDVTTLRSASFRQALKATRLCRTRLGIKFKDLEPGAASSIDSERALEANYLKAIRYSNKSIAAKLGFKIYKADNPSGSYPLLHKYLKLGKEINGRLNNLREFLKTVLYPQ